MRPKRSRARQQAVWIFVAASLLAGCSVGPNYKRPQVAIPPEFRAPAPLPAGQAASLADSKWFEVFRDERLQELIRAALDGNFDLRDAAARVEEARAQLGITRSNQVPHAAAGGAVEVTRLSRNGQSPLPASFLPNQNRVWGTAGLNLLNFEVDLWGRWRRATEAARANLLSAEENRQAVVSGLVSEVAAEYFNLLQLDYMLEISRDTLETRRESLRLVRDRQGGGVATLLDLRQAEELVRSAAQSVPALEQQVGQSENRISLLLGRIPGTVARGGAASSSRQCLRMYPRACRHRCWSAGRISVPPNRHWWRRTRISGWRKRRTSRRSA